MKYKVGDKVKIRSWDSMAKEYGTDCNGDIKIPHFFNRDMKKYCGRVMTICDMRPATIGHGYVYFLEDAAGWRFGEEMFEPTSQTIVIYRKDNEVIALDKSTGKMNKAICSPEDEFDFYTGASLAIVRLMNDEPVPELRKPEKYFTGEIVCYKAFGFYEKGKIYKVKNGYVENDGYIGGPYKSVEEINEDCISKFVEVIR